MPTLTKLSSRRPLSAVAITVAMLLGACTTGSADATTPVSAVVATQTVEEPSDAVAVEPEAVRDQVLAAIADSDDATLESLVPAAALESVGAQLATFVPGSDIPACDRLGDGSAHCIIFENDLPFALEMTLQPSDTLGWTIASVSYDSTN